MLDDLVQRQDGVLTRAQALAVGLTKAQVEAHLTSGRWQRIFPGVYATFSGTLPRRSVLWAAVLRVGAGAMLSHETAAEVCGLTERPSPAIHVTVPAERTPRRFAGIVIHRSTRADQSRHPTRTPPQTRVEDTIIDLTQTATRLDDAISWLARAVGGRHTTPERLGDRLRQRRRLRWRIPLCAALHDVASGAHSLIEVTYLRDVERAHGLPTSQRQVRWSGAARYDDVRYGAFATRVELDGRAAHPEHHRFRDMRRDNEAVVGGDRVLRYGLDDVGARPCQVAGQVATVLQQGGWTGQPRACRRSDCALQ